MNILILCTGNSCRSQMAEGFLRSWYPHWQVASAGTAPAPAVHPLALEVMAQKQIDLSLHRPKGVEQFLSEPWDFVITVCDGAQETCPVFGGQVKTRLHLGFEDPAALQGSQAERLLGFQKIRDQIESTFWNWSHSL